MGLFAIFETGMLKMRCHVVDTLDFVGGQCVALYPEKPIYDIPGHPSINAADLIVQLEQQASPFKPVFHLGQQVVAVKRHGANWHVTTTKDSIISAKAVVIAAGCGAFGPNRPPLQGIEAYEGRSVFYLVKSRDAFRNKRVVIAGGGDSAVDWALALADIAAHIYVVHRRPKFRAAPESVEKMHTLVQKGKAELVIPYQLHGLTGQEGMLKEVIVSDLDGRTRNLQADILLPFFGLAMELGPIAEWGLGIDHNRITVNPATCETSAPGIFAIGDICHYPGKLKLILSGFSEAAMAAHAIYPLVHSGEALHFEYSTTKGVPV